METIDENFNVKKSKKKGLIIGGVILAIIVIAIVLVYFLVISNPKFIFGKAIDKVFAFDSENYDSMKMSTKITASIEADDPTYQTELDEIEKFTLKAGTQVDVEGNEEIFELGLEYDNESMIDAQLYYNDGEMYTYLEGLFDKYIKIDLDEKQQEQVEDIFGYITMGNTDKEYLVEFRNELKAEMKEIGTYEKKKDTIEVDGEEEKVSKITYEFTDEEAYEIFENATRNIGKNKKVLNKIEKSKRNDFEEAMNELADNIEEAATDDDITFKISLYTKGFLNNKLVAVDIEIEDEYSTLGLRIIKEDEGIYSYSVYEKENRQRSELITGIVEIEKEESKNEESGNTTITAELTDLGSAKIKVDYSVEYNQGIDKINTSNNVNINNLTDADFETIITNLMERPLIGDLIKEQFENSIFNTSDLDERQALQEQYENAKATGKTNAATLEEYLNEINANQTNTEENEIIDDFSGFSVKYSVPSGFEMEDYSFDDIKYYTLEKTFSEIGAKVGFDLRTEDAYIEGIKSKYDYENGEKSIFSSNVKLGEIKTITVGDKIFKYQTLSYDSVFTDYTTTTRWVYVWYKLDDQCLFTVEFDSLDEEITEDVIKGFLDINITKIN